MFHAPSQQFERAFDEVSPYVRFSNKTTDAAKIVSIPPSEHAVKERNCLGFARTLLRQLPDEVIPIIVTTIDRGVSAATGEPKWLGHFGVADVFSLGSITAAWADLSALNYGNPTLGCLTYPLGVSDLLATAPTVVEGGYNSSVDYMNLTEDGDGILMLYRLPNPEIELFTVARHGDIQRFRQDVLSRAVMLGAPIVRLEQLASQDLGTRESSSRSDP